MTEFLPCPDPNCSQPCEVIHRTILKSTSGPIEHIKTRCIDGHWFYAPTDYLYPETKPVKTA